jgi:predicted ATP-binding protein involved in virulence
MDVDPVPQVEESTALSAYRELIEAGQAEGEDASALRQRLIAHYGESHSVMLECDRLIRFQRFRLAKGRPEGS